MNAILLFVFFTPAYSEHNNFLTDQQKFLQLENFCFERWHNIESIYMIGNHLLLKFNNHQYQLFNWKTGLLTAEMMLLEEIFPGFSENNYQLQFATTFNFCKLNRRDGDGSINEPILPSMNFRRKRRNINFSNSRFDSKPIHSTSVSQDNLNSLIDEIRFTLNTKLQNKLEQNHVSLQDNFKNFDFQLKKLTNQLENQKSKIISKEFNNFDYDKVYEIPYTDLFQESCMNIVMATFCGGLKSFENQLCNDNFQSRSCWFKTMFFQYIEDKHLGKFRLMPIPFQFNLMSRLLVFRGLFQMSDPGRFFLISQDLKCTNPSLSIIQQILDLHREFNSGLNFGMFDLVQTSSGYLEYLDRSRVSVEKLLLK